MKNGLCYKAPDVEIVEVVAECGFVNSMEDPVESDEQDW